MYEGRYYNVREVCSALGITSYTLSNWYSWERKLIERGESRYLPEPIHVQNERGKPRMWDTEMLEQLRQYKESIIVGRNGRFGEFSNPDHKNTKKYKKQMEEKDEQ